MHDLDEMEARFQGGDSYALAIAMRICANHALPMPAWAAAAFIKGFDKVNNFEANSWDAIFGTAIPKGQHIKALRNRHENSGAVWLEVQRLHQAKVGQEHKPSDYYKAGQPIDDEMFAAIAKKLRIGTTLVKKYYRLEKTRHKEQAQLFDQPGNPIGEVLRRYQDRPKK